MVEINEDTYDELETLAEEHEEDFEDVREAFRERYQETEEKSEAVSDDMVENLALRQTRSWILSQSRVPTDEIEMLTIGGDVRNTSNGDMFFGTAVVDENPDENGRTKLASVRIFTEELASEVYEAFDEVANVISGNFAVSEGDLEGHLEVSDSDDTEFEVARPDDKSSLIEEIRERVPEVTIATIADNMSASQRNDDGDVYTVGSDIRRIQADIYDGYKNPDSGVGTYTVRDETVFDDEDIAESPVHNPEEANENATPGMTCWTDPNKMVYASESVVEMYGTVTKNDDGEIVMNVDGILPLMGKEGFDGYEDSNDDEGPERENVSTEDVSRTSI